jgi:hypothetical protein
VAARSKAHVFDRGFESHPEHDICPHLICVHFFLRKVHLLYESGYFMPCVNNLTKEKPCLSMPDYPIGIWIPEEWLKSLRHCLMMAHLCCHNRWNTGRGLAMSRSPAQGVIPNAQNINIFVKWNRYESLIRKSVKKKIKSTDRNKNCLKAVEDTKYTKSQILWCIRFCKTGFKWRC